MADTREYLNQIASLNAHYLVGYLTSAMATIANNAYLSSETPQEYAQGVLNDLADQAAEGVPCR